MSGRTLIIGLTCIGVGFAGGIGMQQLAAQTPNDSDCQQWVYHPELVDSNNLNGYLFCESDGRLWMIDKDEKKVVREKS